MEEGKLGEIRSDDIFKQMDIKKKEIKERKRVEEELKAKLMDEEADKEKPASKFAVEESKVIGGGGGMDDIDIILKDIKIEDISSPSLGALDSKTGLSQLQSMSSAQSEGGAGAR